MAKQAQEVEETLGLIAQAQAEYERIMEEVRGYCQKARELRQQTDEVRCSGSTNPQVPAEISKLMELADYFKHQVMEDTPHPCIMFPQLTGCCIDRHFSAINLIVHASKSRVKCDRGMAHFTLSLVLFFALGTFDPWHPGVHIGFPIPEI